MIPSKPHSSRRIVVSSSARRVARHAVDVAVGRHDARDPGVADGRLERQQLLVAQLARADVGRRLVAPALGEPVAHHVLGRREDAVGEVRPLERLDVGAAELGGEVRVLAVGLLDPAPAGVARDVEDRRERVPGTGEQHPPADRRRHRRHDVRVEASPPRRSTAGSTARAHAMRPWRHSSWMSAGMPSRVPSTSWRWIALAVSATSIGRRFVEPARRVMWPIPSDASSAQPVRVEAVLADDLERPERPELGDLLGPRHPPQQVRGALVDGQRPDRGRGSTHGRHPLTDPAVRPPTSWRSATR